MSSTRDVVHFNSTFNRRRVTISFVVYKLSKYERVTYKNKNKIFKVRKFK